MERVFPVKFTLPVAILLPQLAPFHFCIWIISPLAVLILVQVFVYPIKRVKFQFGSKPPEKDPVYDIIGGTVSTGGGATCT